MKVHPAPKKRNIALRYETLPLLGQKKLRKLPHIFSKVLELPFHSDADVSVEETRHFLRFTVSDTDVGPDVRAHTLVIHPNVTKLVVRPGPVQARPDEDGGFGFGFGLDAWRFRLPGSTRPEEATARFEDGDLVVVVPKGDGHDDEEETGWGDGSNNNNNSNNSLVLVQ